MMWPPMLSWVLLLWTVLAFANVEKTIFNAPEAIWIPKNQLSVDQLNLEFLTPYKSTLRRKLEAAFPTPDEPQGPASWFLLDSLQQSQRHEVRICWLATQPTDFILKTYLLSEVFASPELISSLAGYSEKRQSLPLTRHSFVSRQPKTSLLFLRINAAADYFTTNETLMNNVPLVDADIILDPYIFDLLPKSLLPIGLHILSVTIIAWYLCKAVRAFFDRLSNLNNDPDTPEKPRKND